jgi:hypothetical protein
MNSWGGYVTISSTIFDRISNCGSIIRNYNIDVQSSSVNTYYFEYDVWKKGLSYKSDLFSRLYRLKDEVYNTLTSGISNPLSCTTSATAGGTQCYTITITGSTFENFNWGKPTGDNPIVASAMGMQYWGQVLTLVNFYGAVTISGNTFYKNQIQYASCNISSYLSNADW